MLLQFDLLSRQRQGSIRQPHVEAGLVCLLYPGVDVVRLRGIDLNAARRPREHGRRPRDDALERVALDCEIVLQRDALGDDQIVARLRLVSVNDRGRTDLEVALRLLQLLRDRPLLRLVDLQIHLGQQHVEVRLRHPQNQLLARQRELRVASV